MEVPRKIERKNPVHRSLHLLLHHMAIHQPEAAEECKEVSAQLDELFAHQMDWEEAVRRQQDALQQAQQTAPPDSKT